MTIVKLAPPCQTFSLPIGKNYSCGTCLLKLVNDGLWAMEHKRIKALAILDLSAAFDTVDHDILLSVLNRKFGTSDMVLQWYQSYLRPRFMKELAYSVPQGSSSWANIFTAHCSMIDEVIDDSLTLNEFADDHSIKGEFDANNGDAELRTIVITRQYY